jgi:hypothetical protein
LDLPEGKTSNDPPALPPPYEGGALKIEKCECTLNGFQLTLAGKQTIA